MKMYFHGGSKETILFDFWRIDSTLGLLLSCVAVFIGGLLFEAMKWIRVYLEIKRKAKLAERRVPVPQREDANGDLLPSPTPCPSRAPKDGPCSLFSLLKVVLYCIQFALAYWVMLVVMTYNTWLSLAVLGGCALGHWIFEIRMPLGRTDSSDGCHL